MFRVTRNRTLAVNFTPAGEKTALSRNLNKWWIDVGFLTSKFCVRSVG